jgi:hypothetical protein
MRPFQHPSIWLRSPFEPASIPFSAGIRTCFNPASIPLQSHFNPASFHPPHTPPAPMRARGARARRFKIEQRKDIAMTEAERRDRASHRCKPHLDTALRLIGLGDTRAEAGGGGVKSLGCPIG